MKNNDALTIISEWLAIAKEKQNKDAILGLLLLQDIVEDKLSYIRSPQALNEASDFLSSMHEKSTGPTKIKVAIVSDAVKKVIDLSYNPLDDKA